MPGRAHMGRQRNGGRPAPPRTLRVRGLHFFTRNGIDNTCKRSSFPYWAMTGRASSRPFPGSLFECGCNLEDVTQTILQTEFVGDFHRVETRRGEHRGTPVEARGGTGPPRVVRPGEIRAESRRVDAARLPSPSSSPRSAPTARGWWRASPRSWPASRSTLPVSRPSSGGTEQPEHNVMIYEVDIPLSIDQKAFRRELNGRAEELRLDVSIQHRDVFETIHRV